MDELLAKTGYQLKGLSRGQKVDAEVLEVGKKGVILNVNSKAEGLVTDRDLDQTRSFIKTLKPGDRVLATVLIPETEGGQALLSLRDAAGEYAWKKLSGAHKKGEEVEVRVEVAIRGGIKVNAEGLEGFIPTSQLCADLAKNPQSLIEKMVKAKVIELNRDKGKLVLSERAVSEAGLLEEQEKVLSKIKVGDRFEGKVTDVVNFGAFVEIEKDGMPITGLVHLSELSWEKIDEPSDVVEVGDKVEVVVIEGEERREDSPGVRLALSIKQAQENPWDKVQEKYKVEDQVKGKVVKLGDFGAFVELEPGIEGLIRLSKIPAGVSLKEGQEEDFFIEEVDSKNQRISLSLVQKKKPLVYK